MSFNNAWNHVRLSLDQQGMSLRAVSLPYFVVTYNFVNCRNELGLLSNPLISLVRSQRQRFFAKTNLMVVNNGKVMIISLRYED